MGKGEIACNKQFLLFPQCFLPVWGTFCHFHQIWNSRLQTHSVWKSLKFVVWERVNQFLGFSLFYNPFLYIYKTIAILLQNHCQTFNTFVWSIPNFCYWILHSQSLTLTLYHKILCLNYPLKGTHLKRLWKDKTRGPRWPWIQLNFLDDHSHFSFFFCFQRRIYKNCSMSIQCK